MLTTKQFRDGTKTVTRRNGWKFAEPGDVYMGCVKCQGLKKGEKIEKIHPLGVIKVQRMPLKNIWPFDVVREGFPGKSPEWPAIGQIFFSFYRYTSNGVKV